MRRRDPTGDRVRKTGRLFEAAVVALLVITALALVLVIGAIAIVKSSWGAERLRRLVLSRVNASLAGQVEVRRWSFPGMGVAVDGLQLRDPGGQLVAEVGHLDVHISLWALLGHHLHVSTIAVDHPLVDLRRDSTGASNLARAVASKSPAPRPPKAPVNQAKSAGWAAWRVTLDALSIRDGTIDVQDTSANSPDLHHVRFVQVDVRTTGYFRGDAGNDFGLYTRLQGAMASPLAAPLSLALDGQGKLGGTSPSAAGNLEVNLGKNSLRLSGQMKARTDAAQAEDAWVNVILERVHVLPSLIDWLVPTSTFKAAVSASGVATWDGASGLLSANVDLAAARANLAVRASLRPRHFAIEALSLRAREIDLEKLVEQGPPSNLSFDLEAHGAGRALAALRGAATLHVLPGQLGGYPLGPVDLCFDADNGHYKVVDFLAVLPGLNATGAGEAVGGTMNLHLAVNLRDLGTTIRSVTAGKAGATVRAAGHGHLELTATGSTHAPSLQASGHFYGLSWQDAQASELHLLIDMPDVERPLASDLSLNIPRVNLAGRQLLGIVASLRAKGSRFAVEAALASPETLHLSVAGDWRRKHSELAVNRLVLALRHETWHLGRPARISWSHGVLRLVGLELRARGAQALQLDLRKEGEQLDGDLTVSALDLAQLPSSLFPAKTKLAGDLGAEVHLRRRADHPTVNANISLSRARFGDLTDLSLSSDVRLQGNRISGQLNAAGLGTKLAGRFEVPLDWPPRSTSLLAAELSISNVDILRISRAVRSVVPPSPDSWSSIAAEPAPELRGQASGHLRLAGTWANPEFTMDATLQQVQVKGVRAGDVAVQVQGLGRKPVVAKLELRKVADGGQIVGSGIVDLRTEATLGSLVQQHFSAATLFATPMHLHLDLSDIDLASWASLAGHRGNLAGTGRLAADLDGTPALPHGNLDLALSRVSSAKFPATDGDVRVVVGDHDVQADARVIRRGKSLLSARARISGSAFRWRDPSAMAAASLELHATLGPLDLQRDGLTAQTDLQPPRIFKGRVFAQVDVTGTMRDPILKLRADADNLRLDDKPIGNGLAIVSYGDQNLHADLALHSANGGELHVTGSAREDLGYSHLIRGPDLRNVPIEARLEANGFDLAGLSGDTPNLRSIAGQIFGSVDVSGTPSDPRPSGRLEWKDGAVTVTGMGEYNHVHLLVHGDRKQLTIDELRAKSGEGQAHLSGKGDHLTEGGYAINTTVDLDRFPTYAEGQVLGTISLKASAETHVSLPQVRSTVAISSAHVVLSGAKRKHLQTLSQPQDVVLVEDGKPLNRTQAKKLAQVNASLATAAQKQKTKVAPPTPVEAPASVVLRIDAQRNLWVSGSDMNVELGLQPGFRIEMADGPHVYGEIRIKRGRVDVVGRRFDLKADSSLRFSGPVDVPELDVTAQYVAEQENVTVAATVKGSSPHLQTTLQSPNRPDLTESQLYTLVVTGHLSLGGSGATGGSTTTNQAASLVGGLLAGQLQKIAAEKLPLDVLTIEGGNSLGTGKLEAGKYLTSDLYVGYVGRLGADPALLQNANAVHLEYELGRHWSFQGEYGDAKTGSADLMWTKHY